LSSEIAPGALGGGFPPIPLSGADRGEAGVAPIPSMAVVHKCADSRWTLGLGMFGVGGFQANYPSSTSNPILLPQNNTPGGFGGIGRIYTEAQYFQIVPTASFALTEKLSVGFAPTVTLGKVAANPLFLTAPDDADGSGAARYPNSSGTRYHWGGGFQVGLYYITDSAWHFGVSLKSTQWMEPTRFKTQDELGFPRNAKVQIDYPLIGCLGVAYSGLENWLFACDVRYFDYANTAGFGDPAAFDATGRVTGLGWDSVMSIHTGVQWRMSDCFFLRAGYQFNESPIHDSVAFFNVASPLITQNLASVGCSYFLTCNLILSASYVHAFDSKSSGPFVVPGVGPLPGTSATSQVSADALSVSLTLRY
jgi:long-chain fatty acid transport protein